MPTMHGCPQQGENYPSQVGVCLARLPEAGMVPHAHSPLWFSATVVVSAVAWLVSISRSHNYWLREVLLKGEMSTCLQLVTLAWTPAPCEVDSRTISTCVAGPGSLCGPRQCLQAMPCVLQQALTLLISLFGSISWLSTCIGCSKLICFPCATEG